MYNIALKQCILGWTGDHEYNQNLLIYSNNKLILRLKRFNLAVATNKRLVMLAFNLLPYYLRTTFFTVSRQMVFCVFYIIICAMPYINNQMWINFLWNCIIQSELHFLVFKICFNYSCVSMINIFRLKLLIKKTKTSYFLNFPFWIF